MKVGELMSRDVAACAPGDELDRVAELMGSRGLGFLPVVEAERVVGVLTDRGLALSRRCSVPAMRVVREAMTHRVWACRPADGLDHAMALMRTHRVRRLPVLDAGERLVGVIALDDLARAASLPLPAGEAPPVTPLEVVETLAAICEPIYPVPQPAAVIDVVPSPAKGRRPRTADEALAARQADPEC